MFLKNMSVGKNVLIGVIALLLVIAVIMLTSVGILFKNKSEIVKVFVLEGVITESYTSTSGITPRIIDRHLRGAEGYGAVVLRINSPGGSVVASQEILGKIEDFKTREGIPVVVSIGEVGASGAYYISLGADKIVANAGSLTGSIGVITEFIYMKGLMEKLGLEQEVVKSGKYKDLGLETLTDEQREVMQKLCDDIYIQFVREVAKSREMTVSECLELATGEVFTGRQALDYGLVDRVGSLDDAIELAMELSGLEVKKVEIKYPSGGSMADLFGMMSDIKVYFDALTETGSILSVRW